MVTIFQVYFLGCLFDEHTGRFSVVHCVTLVVLKHQLACKNSKGNHFFIFKPKLDYRMFMNICQYGCICCCCYFEIAVAKHPPPNIKRHLIASQQIHFTHI